MRQPLPLHRDGAGILLDFHEPLVGILHLELPDGAPGSLDARYGEFPGETDPASAPTTPWYTGQRDTWDLPAGTLRLHSPGRRAFRYLRLSGTERLPTAFHLREDETHPVTERDLFHTDDPLLRRIWDISTRTTRLCMRRYYEDGVKRDGLLWLGDCRVQYLCNLGPFRDHDLMRRSLRMIAASQRDDGAIPACAANGGGHRHPAAGYAGDDRIDCMPGIPRFPAQWMLHNYMCDYIQSVREYTRFSGDPATARELAPSLTRTLRWLLAHSDPATARPFHDYFTDNGLHENGQMLSRPRALAAQLRAAADDALLLADTLGDEALRAAALPLRQRHAVLPPPRDPPCWHEHFLATLAGENNRDDLRAVIEDPDALRPRTAYMWFWAIEAMFRAGLDTLAMDTLRRIWGLLVDLGLDTCPETLYENPEDYFRPGSALSYCHGWAAGPNYLLVREHIHQEVPC